jgi:L-asparagine transporter-like permease
MQARAVLVLCAALLTLMPPLLLVFSQPVTVLGMPLLYVWIFIAWAALVVLGARASRGLSD